MVIFIKILEEIKKNLPDNANISEIVYEGSEIILYTKSKEFFRNNIQIIKRIVGKIKKRIEVRADPSIVIDAEETKEIIKKTVPKDAGIKDIYFEPQFAKVVIHAEKPGLVIGKLDIIRVLYGLQIIRQAFIYCPDIFKRRFGKIN